MATGDYGDSQKSAEISKNKEKSFLRDSSDPCNPCNLRINSLSAISKDFGKCGKLHIRLE